MVLLNAIRRGHLSLMRSKNRFGLSRSVLSRRGVIKKAGTLCLLLLSSLGAPGLEASVFDGGLKQGEMTAPDLSELVAQPGRTYSARLNGNPITYQIATSPQQASSVFKTLAARYAEPTARLPPLPPLKRREKESDGDWKDRQLKAKQYHAALEVLLQQRSLSLQGPGWSGFSAFPTRLDQEGKWLPAYVKRLERFVETGDPTTLGSVATVLAFPGATEAGNTFLSVRFEPGTDVRRLVPHEGQDMPGEDPPGVPRPSHSRRQLSFAQVHEGLFFTLHQYELEGYADPLAGYVDELKAEGWMPEVVSHQAETERPTLVRGGRRVQLSSRQKDSAGERSFVITVITYGG